MAKRVILDIAWIRPLKLIGIANLICGLICFILSLALEDWVVSDRKQDVQFYMGLWNLCQKPRPNDAASEQYSEESELWCRASTSYAGYVSLVQAFLVTAFIGSIVALIVALIAYCKREWRFLYKIAAYILIVCAVLVLIVVILFPVMFISSLPFNAFFWFGWAYGLAWAAFCFVLTAAVLFLVSLDTKEIYHTQKTMDI